MKISIAFAGAVVAALSVAGAASANILYDNPIAFNGAGDCSFNTTCAATFGRGDEFVAQKFTLTAAAVVTGASFSDYTFGASPTDVNWGFLVADGAGGLPGTILASGEDSITKTTLLGTLGDFNVNQDFFGVGPTALGPGTYYFAFQAVSSNLSVYLGQGVDMTGAAESNDGGVTWAFGYENAPDGEQLGGVAVQLTGTGGSTVPEPATWALMLVGFGGIGAALRRRERAASAA